MEPRVPISPRVRRMYKIPGDLSKPKPQMGIFERAHEDLLAQGRNEYQELAKLRGSRRPVRMSSAGQRGTAPGRQSPMFEPTPAVAHIDSAPSQFLSELLTASRPARPPSSRASKLTTPEAKLLARPAERPLPTTTDLSAVERAVWASELRSVERQLATLHACQTKASASTAGPRPVSPGQAVQRSVAVSRAGPVRLSPQAAEQRARHAIAKGERALSLSLPPSVQHPSPSQKPSHHRRCPPPSAPSTHGTGCLRPSCRVAMPRRSQWRAQGGKSMSDCAQRSRPTCTCCGEASRHAVPPAPLRASVPPHAASPLSLECNMPPSTLPTAQADLVTLAAAVKANAAPPEVAAADAPSPAEPTES